MRKPIRTAALAVAALLTLAGSAAIAAPLAPAARPVVAADAGVPIETVACVRGGWHGVGVYRGCGYYGRPYYYRPYPYYVARPYRVRPVYVAPVVVAGPAVVPAPRRCWIAGAWRPC
ncbi:hypothetical protein [Rhodopseudomonas palustris]|uniref:hypothetical protein n=1 Tax=Rhodopseudomonas palustris TaxID=1076 RepID=UPI001A9DAA2D|nr:hypothetical protein [Rhodopseudomonas palustris]